MDDGIGNIVYILLTLLFVIIGLIGNKKNKKDPVLLEESNDPDVPAEDEEAPVFTSFNELLGDLTKLNEPSPEPVLSSQYDEMNVTEYPLDSPPGFFDSKEDSLDTVILDEMVERQVEHVETIPDFIKLTEVGGINENKDLSSIKNTFIEELDIEKAIVYSEIINPKYF